MQHIQDSSYIVKLMSNLERVCLQHYQLAQLVTMCCWISIVLVRVQFRIRIQKFQVLGSCLILFVVIPYQSSSLLLIVMSKS
jgi:hypothetical protein